MNNEKRRRFLLWKRNYKQLSDSVSIHFRMLVSKTMLSAYREWKGIPTRYNYDRPMPKD